MHKKVYPLPLCLKKRFCMRTSRNSGIYPEHEWVRKVFFDGKENNSNVLFFKI